MTVYHTSTTSEIHQVSTAMNPDPENGLPVAVNGLDRLAAERAVRRVRTFSRNVNRLLAGGFASGRITEVCGLPGTGKTLLCLQLCVSAAIPPSFGGLEAESIFIDSEGNFSLERLVAMSESAVKFCQETASRSADPAALSEMNSLSVDSVLKCVRYLPCLEDQELLAAVNILPEVIVANPKIQLIVIDNIAIHFRNIEGDYNRRNKILHHLFQTLLKLATSHNLVVVITNPMTTRLQMDCPSVVVPALGEFWSHLACNRLILGKSRTGNHRTMTLDKSSYLPKSTVPFDIDSGGITDPPGTNPEVYVTSNNLNCNVLDPHTKKIKPIVEQYTVPAKRVKYN